MPQYRAPLDDMRFLLHDVFQAEQLLSVFPETAELNTELMDAILEEAAKICEDLLAPVNQVGDQQGCELTDGKVTTPEGFRQAYATFTEGGWGALTGNPDFGGQGMPKMLSVLFEEMLFASNASFALYPILTNGASLALNLHGSEELKSLYLPKMYEGTWAGTMCLTEAHAGSDLGIMKSRAVPQQDGTYKLTGTKIFITAGDHDLSENIIHFVLAKLPDSPAGAHGISLFLVPKIKVSANGELGAENGVSCGSVEHKMGLKGSATCVMNFEESTGYLIGEENKGLACMFTMMNYERLSMGLQGVGLADASYRVARDYALDRIQGRAPDGPVAAEKAADPIIVHPDVRRMLLTMRANILAGRALILFAASQLDTAKFSSDDAESERASQLVELLTPVVKAYCTDRGFDDCVTGQQVLGGHGYIAEWGQEQAVRDARIAQIYEGTNGIQALDLMGRKTVKCGGEYLKTLLIEVESFCAEHDEEKGLVSVIASLRDAAQELADVTARVIDNARVNPAEVGAASYAYMELMGTVLYGFMWARILVAAAHKKEGRDESYLSSLLQVGRFFFARLMPRYKTLIAEIDSGAETLMAMTAEQF